MQCHSARPALASWRQQHQGAVTVLMCGVQSISQVLHAVTGHMKPSWLCGVKCPFQTTDCMSFVVFDCLRGVACKHGSSVIILFSLILVKICRIAAKREKVYNGVPSRTFHRQDQHHSFLVIASHRSLSISKHEAGSPGVAGGKRPRVDAS